MLSADPYRGSKHVAGAQERNDSEKVFSLSLAGDIPFGLGGLGLGLLYFPSLRSFPPKIQLVDPRACQGLQQFLR